MSLIGEASGSNQSNSVLLQRLLSEAKATRSEICCKLRELIDNGPGGDGGTFDGHIISSCEDPVYVSICQTGMFQPVDCDNTPLGDPIEVLPVLSVGKQQVRICNVQEMAAAINGQSPVFYNTVAQTMVDDIDVPTFTVPANTIHSISYKIISGIVDISIGGVSLPYSAGEFDNETATTTLAQEYIFTPQAGGKVKVKTIS